MTYNEIIQQVGKQIDKSVYYYDSTNTKVDVATDNIEEVKISFKSDLTGTIMKELDLILKEKIDTTNAIYLEIKASYGDNTATKVYGPYYLNTCEYDANEKTYTHYCYDSILKTMVDYEKITMTYPTTLQNYFDTLIKTLGLTSSVSLVNGSKSMSSDVYNGINYTYRSVLQDIAQANGILLYVDGTEIKEASFGSASSQATIDDDLLKNTNIEFGKHFGPINVITLSRSGDSDNIYYPSTLPSNICEYKISDNQLMNDNDRSEYLAGIYTKLAGKEYDIFDTELIGYGGFEPLQMVVFETGGNTYTSYVFNNEIDITAGYNETIYTDETSDTTTDYTAADTTDKKINQTYIIVDKQNQTINSVVSQTIDTSNPNSMVNTVSTISQKVDTLESKISDVANITVEKQSETGEVELDNVNASEPIYVRVYPISQNISFTYPNSNSYPTDDYDGIRILRFENTKTGEIIKDYEIPDDLLYYDADTYDEFILDYENQKCKVIKRCEYDADANVYKLDAETTTEYEYPSIVLTDGNYKVSLLCYDNGYINARLMATNLYTTQFYTKVETDSKITQTKNSIELEVSENYTNKQTTEELQAQVTVNADAIISEVDRAKTNESSLSSRITQTESDITSEVSRATNSENDLSSKITQNANSITSEITNRTNADNDLSSRISQTASDITAEVTRATNKENSMDASIQLKLDTSSLVTQLNASADVINLKSNRFILDSTNCSITQDGTITAKNANIVGGDIKLSGSSSTTAEANLIISEDSHIYSEYGADNIRLNNYTGGGNVLLMAGSVPGLQLHIDNENKLTIISPNQIYMKHSSNYLQCYESDNYGMVMDLYYNGSGKRLSSIYGVVSISDRDLKENIEEIEEKTSLEIVKQLQPVEFNYKNFKGVKHRGLIAQEVKQVLNDNGVYEEIYTKIDETHYGLTYEEFIPDLINAIKCQQKQIEQLKEEIEKLKEEK